MGVRFRRSFKLFPGVRVNVGLKGVSTSFGVRGAHITVGKRGVRGTVGIPGTGFSLSQRLDKPQGRANGRSHKQVDPALLEAWPAEDTPVYVPPTPAPLAPAVAGAPRSAREIASAGTYRLTSPALLQLRETLLAANTQLTEVEDDLAEATNQLNRLKSEYTRKTKSVFRVFHRRRIRKLESGLGRRAEEEVARLTQWQAATRIPIEFPTGAAEHAAWDQLTFAFDQLRRCEVIWDVMRDADVDRVRERSTATRAIERQPVELAFSSHRVVEFEGAALKLGNANGGDIVLYPGLALIESQGTIALVDLRDVTFDFAQVRFTETDTVPSDATSGGLTWTKVNKDGSPDRRFAGNEQIPICLYGKMAITTPTGLNEEWQFSSIDKTTDFARAMQTYVKAMTTA